jgi:serine phosphatase RsbU (regulator of sigma subunit)
LFKYLNINNIGKYSKRLKKLFFVFVAIIFANPLIAAPKRELPDWQKFLYKTYAFVFVDSKTAVARLDSLVNDAKKRKDNERIAHCQEIIGLVNLFQNDTQHADELFKSSEAYFKEKNDLISLGDYEGRKAIIVMNKLKFRDSEKLFLKSLWYFERAKQPEMQVGVYYKTGMMMNFDNRPGDAVTMYTKGLKIAETINDKRLIMEGNLDLGASMMSLGVDDKVGRYLLKAKDIALELKDTAMLTNTAFYLSSFYQERKENAEALNYARMAISFFKNKKAHPFYGTLSALMANYLVETPKLDSAFYFANIALEKNITDQNKTGILDARAVRAKVFRKKKDLFAAKREYALCMPLIEELGYNATAARVYKGYSEVEYELGNVGKAYTDLITFIAINDSIFKQESQKEIAKVEALFQNERKEIQIQNLNALRGAEQIARNNEIQLHNRQKLAMAIGLLIALVFSLFVWKSYKRKKKDNLIIKLQRDEMEMQKVLVEEKNREIMDSITYAKRLQDAILPPVEQIRSAFKQAFILFEPKEIVAGDFYWMDKHNGKIFFAVCDCTGHGVPGAMVSVVGHNALNRCIKEFNLTEPGPILDKLSELVEETFSHSDKDVKDGMDISLCVYDEQNNTLKWSGANNPIWLLRNGSFHEIKGDKQPIGKYYNRKPFSSHSVDIKSEDCLYLFSDGYADQFGGVKGKKFKYAQLRELLVSIHKQNMDEQLQKLKNAFQSWKGKLDQVDDVCVIGIKI